MWQKWTLRGLHFLWDLLSLTVFVLSNFINWGKEGHEVTREIFFANILILIIKFIMCGFIYICSYKDLEDDESKN